MSYQYLSLTNFAWPPNVKDIPPGNVAKNEKIKQLRARWECSQTKCQSEFCYVPADGPHFPLGHDHFDKWAAATVSSDHSFGILSHIIFIASRTQRDSISYT
jgi:hypothetical protein